MEKFIWTAKKNPNFTLKDGNRPLFFNKVFHDKKVASDNTWTVKQTIETLKNAWIKKTFGEDEDKKVLKNFDKPTRLNGTVKVYTKEDEWEKWLNVSYVMIKEGENTYFYFVTSARVDNNSTVEFRMIMDTHTTYFDKLSFGKDAKIERRHFDRWTIEGDHIVANNAEDSGIWNDENEVQNGTFIKKQVVPVNVLTQLRNLLKNPAGGWKNEDELNGAFWPLFWMAVRDYGGNTKTIPTPLKFFDNALGTVSTTPLAKMPSTFSSILMTRPTLGVIDFSTNKEEGLSDDMILETDINDHYSAYIIKAFTAPLPFINIKGFVQMGKRTLMGYIDEQYTPQKIWDPVASVVRVQPIFDLYGTTVKKDGTYAKNVYNFETELITLLKNKLPLNTLSNEFKIDNEVKLETTKHKQIKIRSINGQFVTLVNEFLFKDEKLKFDISQALNFEGVYQFIDIKDNSFYSIYNKDKTKTLVISYKDQLPNASSKYADFMATQGNSYKTALANNRLQMGMGIAGSLVGGAVSMVKGNPLGAGMAVFGAGNAIAGGIAKERALEAQVKDLQNLGTTTEIDDISIIKDIEFAETYGDSKLAITVEEHPQVQKEAIASYYNKYGYSANKVEHIEDYTYFDKRSLFTFIQSPIISNAINKEAIGTEVIDDIDNLYAGGVRLWAVQDEEGNLDINNYEKENWEHEVKKHVN